ncbi:hypothetical protein [Streptomyces anulatus]|uniref:hypothetical protein n=1 Tax=Streptomyces anulatus TaxID=1892 RepID=UPI001C274ED7|nr:hypothetical protein [Streptomyces anulatus]
MTDLTGNNVSLGRERVLAGDHWLLSAATSPRRALADWTDCGTTFLTPGVLFGAVIIQASVVHASLLLDGPGVLCDPQPLATLVSQGHGVLTGTLGKRP